MTELSGYLLALRSSTADLLQGLRNPAQLRSMRSRSSSLPGPCGR